MIKRFFIAIIFLSTLLHSNTSAACQCPVFPLTRSLTSNYQLIFYGKVVEVHECMDKPGEAIFEVKELYQGNTGATFTMVYDCKDECYLPFNKGDEWLIYANYRQMGNARMEWCSRSRKMMSVPKEDFYTVNYGTTFDDDIRFLRDTLGVHRTMSDSLVNSGSRNAHPDLNSTIITLLISLAGMVGFYLIIRRFFRKRK